MGDKIKVMHITGWLEVGGIEEMLHITAQHSSKERYDLSFVFCKCTDWTIGRKIEKIGYPVIDLGLSSRIYDLRVVRSLIKIFRRYNPHIVHIYDKTSIPGRLAARIAGVPRVVCHEVSIDYGAMLKVAGMIKRKLEFLTDEVIYCSKAVRMSREKNASLKGVVVYPPFNTMKFQSLDNSDLSLSRGKKNSPLIGTVSRVDYGKGHEDLIRAMPAILEKIPGVRLMIVGKGPYTPLLSDLARKLNVDHSIEFAGYVDDLPGVLRTFDLFVLPSLSEGFPLSVMEAMATGIPVAASNVGGIPEMVDDGVTGRLFKAGDPESISTAVCNILSDRKSAEEMGRRAREKALKEYHPNTYLKSLDYIYQRLMTANPQ